MDDVDGVGADESSALSNALSAPSRRGLGPRARVDAATPISRPPTRTAARAWMRPMKPVPAMPTPRGVSSIGRDAIGALTVCQAKVR